MKNLPPSELSRRRLVPSKRQRKVPKDEEIAEDAEGPADEGHIASDALNDFPPRKWMMTSLMVNLLSLSDF